MIKQSTLKGLLIHLMSIIVLSIGLVLGFFYVYLPKTTNHGESITVPNLKGMTMDELDEFLLKRSLRYEVYDSGYSNKHPPLTILKQYPKTGSKVKENRKIFISVNRVNPPTVPMPNLIDGPLKNAQVVLKSNELNIGEVSFKPDLALNAVLEQNLRGKHIPPGTKIPKGSTIDLVIGNGYGNRDLHTPNLISYPFDEAKYYIKGIDLKVGKIKRVHDSLNTSGYIYKQSPSPESNISIGESIDLWVVPEYDATKFEYYEQIFAKQNSVDIEK